MQPQSITFNVEETIASCKRAFGQEHPWGGINLLAPAVTLFTATLLKQLTYFQGIDRRLAAAISLQTVVADLFAGMLLKEPSSRRIIAGAAIPLSIAIAREVHPLSALGYVVLDTISRVALHQFFKVYSPA